MKQQVVGHVSPETALDIPNYQLNKRYTPMRYWVETKRPYGQRLMKQIFDHRSGTWFKPKAVDIYHDTVVMFYDPSFEPELRNFSSNGEFITTDNINFSLIGKGYAEQYLKYYNLDQTQIDLFNEWLNPGTAPIIAHRGPGRPPKESNPAIESIKIRQAEIELEKKEVELQERKLRLHAAELSLKERERKLLEPKPTAPAPLAPSPLTKEQCLEIEEINHFIQVEPKFIGSDYDMEHEELQRPQMERIIAYCKEHPEYLPTNTARFIMRGKELGLDDQINKLPCIVAYRNPPPKTKPTAAQINAMEKELLK